MRLSVRRIQSLFVTVIILMACQSCQHRELCYDHSHTSPVSLIFDWSLAPDADPSTMVVWFFPVDGSAGTRFELTRNGSTTRGNTAFNTEVKVAPGQYFLVSHNGDTDNNIERGNSFHSYHVQTYDDNILSPMNRDENAPRPDDTGSQPIRSAANTLYSHTHPDVITVEPSATKAVSVIITPREVTAIYNILITDVTNLTAETEASAVVTGVAETWHPASESPAGTEVIVPFALNHCGQDCLRGSVVLFGDNAPHDLPHKLRVYTSYKYYYDFDITDQVHSAPDPRHVDIVVHGLRLPQGSGSGMSPGVSDWGETIDQDIKM